MNTKIYDTYGLKCEDLDTAKKLVENVLKIKMVAHESGYHCGIYFRFNDTGSEHFILQKNYDELENEWAEVSFTQYPQLLYINETLRSDEIANLLEAEKGIALFKHQVL